VLIAFDGGIPAGAVVTESEVLISSSGLAQLGIAAGDAGYLYAKARVCAVPADGGTVGDAFLPGFVVVDNEEATSSGPCAADAGQVELWTSTRTDAPFRCAAAIAGASQPCRRPDGGAAPLYVTLSPGAWVPGPGCFPKTCEEQAGFPSWNPAWGVEPPPPPPPPPPADAGCVDYDWQGNEIPVPCR
jgi:hypothetical protein